MIKKIAVAAVAIPLTVTLAVAGLILWFCTEDNEDTLEWSDYYQPPGWHCELTDQELL